MSMCGTINLEKVCGRPLSEAEAARLKEIGSRLGLREDDALWPLLAALEYQRVFYEALPEKIVEASREIIGNMEAAAENVPSAAQAKLTESVIREVRHLASERNYDAVAAMVFIGGVCVALFGSLMLWAGYNVGTDEKILMPGILYMPSGWLVAGLCAVGTLICGYIAMQKFLNSETEWGRHLLAAFCMFVVGLVVFQLL